MHSFNGSRQRRNLLDLNGFAPIHIPLTSYSTDSQTRSKDEMKHTYGDTLFFNNLHLIPDPLKKNLADSVITGEEKKGTNMVKTKEAERPQRPDYYPSLAGITSFFSGVLNVMGAIFQKRTTSPTSQYYDCFEDYNDQQMAPSPWQSSNIEVQNKNERDLINFATNNELNTNLEVEMSADCRLAASHCEEKLNQVRLLLTSKNKRNEQPSKFGLNRPRKAFIEAGSVDESFEDAFTPKDVTCLADNTYIEYYSPYNHHNEEYIHAEAPKVKTEMCTKEPTDIVYSLPVENNQKNNVNEPSVISDSNSVNTEEIVSSCEEKLSKLKALLKSKGKNVVNNEPEATLQAPEITNPIPIPVHSSEKSEGHKDMPKETVFGNEINSMELQSSQDSDCFNEVTGKFFSSSLESEDSFQIVFSDSPPNCRRRIPSECDSEDSFIVFEESPDSCYTSHDVFGEDFGEVNHSDFDSDIDEDSGITCKLAHNLSRTFGDLTDDSLYSQDVVDSVQVCNDVFNDIVNETEVIQNEERDKKCGLLLNERRKAEKRKLPPKKVTFSSQPPKVHVMRVWAFAARQARAGHWERHALDRERFKRRIADVEMAISWVFKRQHRTRIVFQRFRPWWNAERRRELAEKKEKEEQEKERKKEEERIAQEVQGNVVSETEGLTDNTDIENVSTVDKDVDTQENVIQNGTNELSVDCNGLTKNGQSLKCDGIIKKYSFSPYNDSGELIDDVNTEKSKLIETVSNGNNSFEQYWDHSNFKTNNSNNVEFNDSIVKTPGIKDSIKIATPDDKSNIIHDLQIKDASVDT